MVTDADGAEGPARCTGQTDGQQTSMPEKCSVQGSSPELPRSQGKTCFRGGGASRGPCLLPSQVRWRLGHARRTQLCGRRWNLDNGWQLDGTDLRSVRSQKTRTLGHSWTVRAGGRPDFQGDHSAAAVARAHKSRDSRTLRFSPHQPVGQKTPVTAQDKRPWQETTALAPLSVPDRDSSQQAERMEEAP